MKKYAFLLMGDCYDTMKHQAHYEIGGLQTSLFTVKDLDDACSLVKKLHHEGYGAIELCGAFGEEGAKRLIELTNNEIAIGYVTHFPEQDLLFKNFFA